MTAAASLFVSPPATDRKHFEAVSEALRIVGVTLVATLADEQPALGQSRLKSPSSR